MELQPSSRMCFVCGVENPAGLGLAVHDDRAEGRVVSTVAVPARYQGYPGVVHGGVVAAMLDEVAGRAVLLDAPGDLMVTVKIEVRYRQPTPTETPLTITGRVVQPGRARARAAGEIRLADGTVTAEAEVVLARPPASIREAWDAERPYWKIRP